MGTLEKTVRDLNFVPEEKSSTPPSVSSEVEAVAESDAEAPSAVLEEPVAVQQPATVEKAEVKETQKEVPPESTLPAPTKTEFNLFNILSLEEEEQKKRFGRLLDKTREGIRVLVSRIAQAWDEMRVLTDEENEEFLVLQNIVEGYIGNVINLLNGSGIADLKLRPEEKAIFQRVLAIHYAALMWEVSEAPEDEILRAFRILLYTGAAKIVNYLPVVESVKIPDENLWIEFSYAFSHQTKDGKAVKDSGILDAICTLIDYIQSDVNQFEKSRKQLEEETTEVPSLKEFMKNPREGSFALKIAPWKVAKENTFVGGGIVRIVVTCDVVKENNFQMSVVRVVSNTLIQNEKDALDVHGVDPTTVCRDLSSEFERIRRLCEQSITPLTRLMFPVSLFKGKELDTPHVNVALVQCQSQDEIEAVREVVAILKMGLREEISKEESAHTSNVLKEKEIQRSLRAEKFLKNFEEEVKSLFGELQKLEKDGETVHGPDVFWSEMPAGYCYSILNKLDKAGNKPWFMHEKKWYGVHMILSREEVGGAVTLHMCPIRIGDFFGGKDGKTISGEVIDFFINDVKRRGKGNANATPPQQEEKEAKAKPVELPPVDTVSSSEPVQEAANESSAPADDYELPEDISEEIATAPSLEVEDILAEFSSDGPTEKEKAVEPKVKAKKVKKASQQAKKLAKGKGARKASKASS